MTNWNIIIADRLALVPKYRDVMEDGSIRLISLVEQSLNKIGAQVYFPRERIAITRLNRRIKVNRSLLYSYAFVSSGAEHHDIRNAKGVYKLLEDIDGNVANVSERTVERFRRNERYGVYDQTSRSKHAGLLTVGTRVRVLAGKFEGYTGVVRRSTGIEKARVFLADKFVVHLPIDILVDV